MPKEPFHPAALESAKIRSKISLHCSKRGYRATHGALREPPTEYLSDTPRRTFKAYTLASVYNRAGNDQITKELLAAGSMLKQSVNPIRQ
jgi:hypothetical protein